MSVATRPVSYEDLLQLPDDGNRYEIIDGVLYVSPPPSRRHQKLAYRFVRLLGEEVDRGAIGELYFAPVDVKISPFKVVQPDLLFIRRERLAIFKDDAVVGAPDLVIEILSPWNRANDEVLKAKLYAEAGVPEYWLADPFAETLRIMVLVDGVYREVPHEGGFVRSTVLPEFSIDVVELFRDLD